MIDPLYDSRNPNHDRIGGLRVMRCSICDWPMAESREGVAYPAIVRIALTIRSSNGHQERRDSIRPLQAKQGD